MAASHSASMRGMGLQGLPPQQVSEGFSQAGYAPRHVSARLMLSQFTKVNTAKGKWALLANLLTTPIDPTHTAGPPSDASTHSSNILSASTPIRIQPSGGSPGVTSTAKDASAPCMGTAEIEQLVRRAAAEVLGEEMSADGRFASSHFDSLAAVELSNSIGKAMGLDLPGTSGV